MKKVYSILILLITSVVCFAQEDKGDDGIKPKKFASWTLSKGFQAEPGHAGSHWKPTMSIAIDKEGYYCVVNLYNATNYYSVNNEILPHLYLKTENGDIVDLEMDNDEPIHTFYLKGYYFLNVWMPGRYVTCLIYKIPNIESFLSNYYVKYRVWYGEEFKDVELNKSFAKKFNNRLKEATDEVTEKYEKREKSLNNPLEGF